MSVPLKEGAPSASPAESSEPRIPREFQELWKKIASFEIDDSKATRPLSMRLAQEQDWTHPFALRVIEEYRKFIFMIMVSDRMCTPSLIVDEAWHLHLLYTRSYWVNFCLRTLGRLIHHEPGDGNPQSEAAFQGHYTATLNTYRQFFGEPPADIWGCSDKDERNAASGAALRTQSGVGEIPASDQGLLAEIAKAAARLLKFRT